MIDPTEEKLIPLSEVPGLDWMPQRRGRRPSRSAVYRWATGGIRDVRLETVTVGGFGMCTSKLALLRFFERLSMPAATIATPIPSQNDKAQDRARKILAAAGIR